VFGYPVQQQLSRKKPTRYRREFIVHENTYRRMSEIRLKEMMDTQARDAGLPIQDFKQVLNTIYTRKFASDFALEMNRSSLEWMKSFLPK